MPKSLQIVSKLSFLFIIIVFGHYIIVAQATLAGDWKADTKTSNKNVENQDKIYLSFSRQTEKGGRNQNGSSYNYAELKNLTRDQALKGGAVKFSLVREAGTIECDGNFADGKGAGTFRFTANPQFISAMKSRGFSFEKNASDNEWEGDNKLFLATTLNVTTALADDLLSANFGKLETDDLFKAKIFKIDSGFLREMKASDFPNLGMEELVKARIFKIDGDYLRRLNAAGFGKEPFENVVKMRIFKITPEFIAELRGEGLNNLSIEELTKMKIFNINGAFIRQAKADKVDLNVEDLVRRRIGVWGK